MGGIRCYGHYLFAEAPIIPFWRDSFVVLLSLLRVYATAWPMWCGYFRWRAPRNTGPATLPAVDPDDRLPDYLAPSCGPVSSLLQILATIVNLVSTPPTASAARELRLDSPEGRSEGLLAAPARDGRLATLW